MFRNHLKIAFRNIRRQKGFSFINIIGLAIGMACSILILLWVQDETNYDQFHTNADRLYRITGSTPDIKAAVTVAPLASALQEQVPSIKSVVRLSKYYSHLFEVGNHKFEEPNIFYADSNFLEVFSFPLLKGDAKTALHNPNGILISEAMAIKYFGKEEAFGKIIRMDKQDDFIVTGVLANVPHNSHLQFDFIIPIAFLARSNVDLKDNRWCCFNFYTYIEVSESFIPSPSSLQTLSQEITKVFATNSTALKVDFHLQPLASIHLEPELLADVPGHGNRQYVQTFSLVAVFILLVACINFMNLATARSARRAREVGLRKSAGARRGQLIWQFLGESSLISMLALLIAVFIAAEMIPLFNDVANKKLSLDFQNPEFILSLTGIALITGLLSGSYPALFLSGFQPIKVLKGNLELGRGNSLFRNALVVSQFVVSIALLVGTAVVYFQLEFIRNKNLGFDKENLLYMPMNGELWGKQKALEAELMQNPLTSNYSITQELPTNLISGTNTINWEGKNPDAQPVVYTMSVDENFIDIFQMEIISGRNFSEKFRADTANFIVNETALQIMGMNASSALGKPLSDGDIKGNIIGVVKDFNFKPVQSTIEPLVLELNRWGGIIVIRTHPGETEATIRTLEKINQKLNPNYPFGYSFVDQDLANLYQSEQRMGTIFNVFAGLAIFISCLGLYGLSAFIAEQRTKEIGVRKVLGASVFNIVQLLSTNFVKLIAIATAIAIPASWFVMNRWLEGFAYHIDITWSIFAIACFTTIVTAGITVSYESIKAALNNPVKSLRNE